jgi:hypothetical protein
MVDGTRLGNDLRMVDANPKTCGFPSKHGLFPRHDASELALAKNHIGEKIGDILRCNMAGRV